MTPFLMFATVMQAIIIKAPTMKPSLHDSSMYPSGVAASRQCPSKLAFRRAILGSCPRFRSGCCNGAIIWGFQNVSYWAGQILRALESSHNPEATSCAGSGESHSVPKFWSFEVAEGKLNGAVRTRRTQQLSPVTEVE
jgi:hypothetical protein